MGSDSSNQSNATLLEGIVSIATVDPRLADEEANKGK